ncbi:hypothetical protein [Streptomyces sp. AV19]|uniref:hypothetical protein n=1 Tax=Streptomyces sp. AV19 TaxID=2793068 RepID=UPI001F480227|nr:hypothetical protein [Streptomyces sp. AV19]MDG4533843.1 hypothetical protein [Streptomyces sp. AV19]
MSSPLPDSPPGNTPGPPNAGAFDAEDARRLASAVARARTALGSGPPLPSGPPPPSGRLTAGNCDFAHCGLLLFPSGLDAAVRHLTNQGLAPSPPVPSVVVRRRLGDRYGVAAADCEVWITRLHLTAEGRTDAAPAVEVFLFPRTAPALDRRIVERERLRGFENHTALQVRRPTRPLVEELFDAWCGDGGLLWEGGGYSPHEGRGGSTVLYFVRDQEPRPAALERWELNCPGDFRPFLADRPVDTAAVARAYRLPGA